MVFPGGSLVYHFSSLSENSAEELMQRFPPFFASGTAIFASDRWKIINSPVVRKQLNPNNERRILFIDQEMIETYGVQLKTGALGVNIAEEAKIPMYGCDQALHPERVAPRLGLAINPGNGRQFPQPAHRRLVVASVLMGYRSPYWITEKQAKQLFNVDICDKGQFVKVSFRDSYIVPFVSIPKTVREKILKRRPPPSNENRRGLMIVLDADIWEPVMSPAAVKKLNAVNALCQVWISVRQASLDGFDLATFNPQQHPGGCADFADLTAVKLYNAENTTNPHAIFYRDGTLALVDGRRVPQRLLEEVSSAIERRRYLSPIWVTKEHALKYGVRIKPGERPVSLRAASVPDVLVYNLDDLENTQDFLQLHPPPKDGHAIFLMTWKPVHSVQRQRQLSTAGYSSKLWVVPSEVPLNRLQVRQGANTLSIKQLEIKARRSDFNVKDLEKKGLSVGPRQVFNAEQTTDPIAVNTLMACFLNPPSRSAVQS